MPMTVKEIGRFIAELPADSSVIAVVQRGPNRMVMITGDIKARKELEKEEGFNSSPKWTQAVWSGIEEALG